MTELTNEKVEAIGKVDMVEDSNSGRSSGPEEEDAHITFKTKLAVFVRADFLFEY